MLTLRDVNEDDKSAYVIWQNDQQLSVYLSRLCPNDSKVDDYDSSNVCWFIIENDNIGIGSVWLEKDKEQTDTMILGVFILDCMNRGKGIGCFSIIEAIRIAKQRIPFRKVRLHVRKSNITAIQCYEKCGFNIYGEGQKPNHHEINYYKMELKVEDLYGYMPATRHNLVHFNESFRLI